MEIVFASFLAGATVVALVVAIGAWYFAQLSDLKLGLILEELKLVNGKMTTKSGQDDKNIQVVSPKSQSPLTISDWITFLSSEKQGLLGNWINAITLIFSIFAAYSLVAGKWELLVGSAVFILALCTTKLVFPSQDGVAKLLKRIMRQELNNVTDIRTAWEIYRPNQRR